MWQLRGFVWRLVGVGLLTIAAAHSSAQLNKASIGIKAGSPIGNSEEGPGPARVEGSDTYRSGEDEPGTVLQRGKAFASAGFASLRVLAETASDLGHTALTIGGGGATSGAEAYAEASLFDQFIIHGPEGQEGIVAGIVSLHGFLTTTNTQSVPFEAGGAATTSKAAWYGSLSLGSSLENVFYEASGSVEMKEGVADLNGVESAHLSWSIRFVFNEPIDLNKTAWASSESTTSIGFTSIFETYPAVNLTATSSANYARTILWGGFTSVLDANGNEVTDYTVSSLSGFDYSKASPVPEPVSAAVLAGGLGWLAFQRRRRQ